MKTDLQNTAKVKPYEERVEKKFSGYMWMMAFAMVSMGVVFLTLTTTYLFSKTWNNETISLVIPAIFYIDTFILVVGSLALHFAAIAFKRDEIDRYKICLYIAMLSGISFLIGQIGGWVVLADIGFGITEHKSASFLYVISGIHALHIIGGLVFLSYIFIQASKRLQEPALAIVYFTDPLPRQHLRLMKFYWHFLGAIWLYLLVFFMIVR
jgi:cytochrome c oxidase subunit 3